MYFPEAMDNATPTSAPSDESMPPSAAASKFAVTTDPRKAAGQVGEILKARNAERDNIFKGVLALAGYICTAGVAVIAVAFALEFIGVFEVEHGVVFYLLAVGYCIGESGPVLMSTLPPETFDLDVALDDRRGARRAVTIVVVLLNGMQGLSFPHISGLGALGLLVKLVWDESVAGFCRRGARATQHDAGDAIGFHDEEGRRVHNPTDVGCGARFRPRLSDTLTLCFYGIVGLQYGGKYAFSTGLCHAAVAQGPGMAANTFTSNGSNWTTPTDSSFLHNSTTLGNVTNSSSITMCGGWSYK